MHNLRKSLVRGHSDFHKTDFVEWEFDAICAALMSVGFSSCISLTFYPNVYYCCNIVCFMIGMNV